MISDFARRVSVYFFVRTRKMPTPTRAPRSLRLPSRLCGFHLIVLASFTLLGFYVCLRQVKAVASQVASLKQDLERAIAPGPGLGPGPGSGAGAGAGAGVGAASPVASSSAGAGGNPFAGSSQASHPIPTHEPFIQDDDLRDALFGFGRGMTIYVDEAEMTNDTPEGFSLEEVRESEHVSVARPDPNLNTIRNTNANPNPNHIANSVPGTRQANTVPEPDRDLQNMSVRELRAEAARLKVSLKAGAKKSEIVAVLSQTETSDLSEVENTEKHNADTDTKQPIQTKDKALETKDEATPSDS